MSATAAQLRDELLAVRADPTASNGRRVNAWEAWVRQSNAEGHLPDALRRFCEDEVERFWSYTIPGPSGHTYWDGPQAFIRNGGRSQRPQRWVWEQRHGPFPSTTDVWAACGEANCVTPEHLEAGRAVSRYAFSDDAIIGAAQVAGMRLGHPPGSAWWRRNARPEPKVIIQRFGSWERFLRAAGFDAKAVERHMAGRGRVITYDEQQLVEALRALAAKIGHTPSSEDWYRHRDWARAHGYPRSPNTFRERIGGGTWRGGGSWIAALKRAGLA